MNKFSKILYAAMALAMAVCNFSCSDDEDDLELVGDTALTSVQVEWILLKNRMVKKYYFERTKGVWMLEAINLRQIEQGENEDFVAFYLRFVTDSVYQSRHIREPLEYITIDPDDELCNLGQRTGPRHYGH